MGDRPLPAVLPAGRPRLGHAVIKVSDLERALAFYRDALGLLDVARHGGDMVFLSSGETHHELALVQVEPGEQAGPAVMWPGSNTGCVRSAPLAGRHNSKTLF